MAFVMLIVVEIIVYRKTRNFRLITKSSRSISCRIRNLAASSNANLLPVQENICKDEIEMGLGFFGECW